MELNLKQTHTHVAAQREKFRSAILEIIKSKEIKIGFNKALKLQFYQNL